MGMVPQFLPACGTRISMPASHGSSAPKAGVLYQRQKPLVFGNHGAPLRTLGNPPDRFFIYQDLLVSIILKLFYKSLAI